MEKAQEAELAELQTAEAMARGRVVSRQDGFPSAIRKWKK